MKYFLGLDNGGTATKAAVYDLSGKEMAVASLPTRALSPKPGFFERDMDELWNSNCAVIRQAVEKAGISPEEIEGVAVCGHGKGLYLWGKDNRPLGNGILSSDSRARAYAERWRKDGTEERAFCKTYQKILPCQPVSLLAWLKEREPSMFSKIRWVFECKDYIRFRLTGEAGGEITDYSGTGLVNLSTRQYDRELLRLFSLEEIFSSLPPLCGPFDLCGRVTSQAAAETGLAPGTPGVGGMFDIDACAAAVGITQPDTVCMIAGTWSINEYLREKPVLDGSVALNSFSFLPNYFLVEESSPTSAGNLEWIIDRFFSELRSQHGKNVYSVLDQMVQQVPPEESYPLFTPFLMGSSLFPNAKASFVGLDSFQEQKHLAKAAYEGIVFSHKTHLERLKQSSEQNFKCVRLAGGAARSRVWSQMFADILELPVEVMDIKETGALGCAMAAAVGTGTYEGFEQAFEHMGKEGYRLFPRPETFGLYRSRYQIYLHVNQGLSSVWNEMEEKCP